MMHKVMYHIVPQLLWFILLTFLFLTFGCNKCISLKEKSLRGSPYGLLVGRLHPNSNVGAAAHKVFPHWSQKTITHHCLSLFPIVSWLGYQTNGFLGLGELLHDRRPKEYPFFGKRNLKVGKPAIWVYKDASYGPYGCGNDKKTSCFSNLFIQSQ